MSSLIRSTAANTGPSSFIALMHDLLILPRYCKLTRALSRVDFLSAVRARRLDCSGEPAPSMDPE